MPGLPASGMQTTLGRRPSGDSSEEWDSYETSETWDGSFDSSMEGGAEGGHHQHVGFACCGDGMSAHRPRKRNRTYQDFGRDLDEALKEERTFIASRMRDRDTGQVPPFSLAFSGGGVRAAAFQAGVLWRLAEMGCLNAVDYFVAVSGGAYVTCAFASHLVSAKMPAPGETLAQWYQRIVARTLCRMQRNAGYLVRDWEETGPCKVASDDSGLFPPVFDAFILFGVVLFSWMCNPITYFVVYIIPLTECVNFFMGMSMRAAYCAPTNEDAWVIFEWWGPLRSWFAKIFWLLVFTFGAWLLGHTPCCGPPKPGSRTAKTKNPTNPRWHCRFLFLYLQSLRAATTRILVIYFLIVVALCGILSTELYGGSDVSFHSREEMCTKFFAAKELHSTLDQRETLQCDDMRRSDSGRWEPWWRDPIFDHYRHGLANEQSQAMFGGTSASSIQSEDSAIAEDPAKATEKDSLLLQLFTTPFSQVHLFRASSFCISMVVLLLSVLGVALVLTPIFEGLFIYCLSLVGPTVAIFLAASFMQWRIFGPLTSQYYLNLADAWPFDNDLYQQFRLCSLVLAFVLMVFFHSIHFVSHYYYTRSLRMSYFDEGEDVTWEELRRHPHCPFIVLTGTVTDWKRPGEEEAMTEISISCLHTGSEKTSFVATPPWRSVAKCMALAAAAIDVFFIGMLDRVRYRFWLEFLNLRMGDYILFERRRLSCVSWCQKRMPSCRRESFFIYEFPVVACGGTAFVFFIAASLWSQSGQEETCRSAYFMYVTSLYIVIIIFFLSFFGFVPCLEFFVHSPMVRQLHMAMKYHHVSETPPSMVYISDGGVQDCTGIIQLMLRRSPRILLALAAHDPHDELTVLRTTMELAKSLKLGSFYDPKDPRREVSVLLDEFRRNQHALVLQLGIRYGWESSNPSECAVDTPLTSPSGRLIIVKNRLPPDLEELQVEAPLTEEEICRQSRSYSSHGSETSGSTKQPESALMSESQPPPQEELFDSRQETSDFKREALKQRQLAGCCCNCCHRMGCNCGPKFPHIDNANQCLTPVLFTSLCRLGYRVSKDAVDLIMQPDTLEDPWEKTLDSS